MAAIQKPAHKLERSNSNQKLKQDEIEPRRPYFPVEGRQINKLSNLACGQLLLEITNI